MSTLLSLDWLARRAEDGPVYRSGDRWQVTNDETGTVEVVAQLEALGACLVVSEAIQLLDALLTRRRQLLEMLVAEKNRLVSRRGPFTRSIRQHIR